MNQAMKMAQCLHTKSRLVVNSTELSHCEFNVCSSYSHFKMNTYAVRTATEINYSVIPSCYIDVQYTLCSQRTIHQAFRATALASSTLRAASSW